MNLKRKRLECYILIQFTLIFSVVSIFLLLKLMGKVGLSGCAFLETTHLYCPGCGGTRAAEALIQLDLLSSIKYNAIIPVGFLLFLYYDIRFFASILKNDMSFFKNNKYIPIVIFAIFLLVYFILRNVFLVCGIDFMTMS